MVHFRRPLALAALVALLSGCGGGGGSSPIPSTGGSGAAPTQPAQKTGPANMVIYIPPPSKQNTHFRPNYISAATQSMTVGLVSGATITSLATINLTQSSSNCTVPAGGGLQCTATVQAPFGTDTFAVSTYSATNGGGSLLSTGQIQETLQLGGTEPTVQISLNGVPSTVSLALGTATLPVGSPGATSVIVQAYDASNNLIIGPGVFANSFTLAITGDTHNTLSLNYGGPSGSPAQTSITSPGQVATLNYTGGTNIGSKIAASGSGISATPVTFNATGAVLNFFQYDDTVNGVTIEPYAVATMSNATAAVATEVNDEGPSSGIAIASPTGISKIFVGDTSNYYNPAAAGETIPGVTVVNKMSTSLNFQTLGAYDDVAASGTTVYYSGSTSGSSCGEEEELQTGTLGVLDSVGGTTKEYVLQGYAGPMHVDNSGNVWFIEYSGECGESWLIPSEYAIGKFNGTTVTETPFASISGLPSLDEVEDMSISPDGSTMYIADSDYAGVYKVSTASMALTASVSLSLTEDVRTVATAADGTTVWFPFSGEATHEPYGYVPGADAFSTADMTETGFPLSGFYVPTVAWADQSFWAGSTNSSTPGLARLSGVSAGTPLAAYYPPPPDDDTSIEIQGVAGGNGYIWFLDSCQGTIIHCSTASRAAAR